MNHDQKYPWDYNDISPPISDALDNAKQLILELKETLYKYNLKKFVGCINKRYDRFMDFVENLKVHMEMAPPMKQPDIDAWEYFLFVQ